MHWWQSTWARWLGWTVTYALIIVVGSLVPPGGSALSLWLRERGWYEAAPFVSTFVLAVVAAAIGARLRHYSWVLGPPVAYLVPLAVYLRLEYLSMLAGKTA